jgi:hypothetical protein
MRTEITFDLRSQGQPITERRDAMLLVLLVFVGTTAPGIALTEVQPLPGRWRVGFPEQYVPAADSRPIHLRFGVCEIREVQR